MTKETIFSHPVRRGDKDTGGEPCVRRIQEWLCLHGDNILIDGDFGPATESAVKSFQARIVPDAKDKGVVCKKTFNALIKPMSYALKELNADRPPRSKILSYAGRHLASNVREVGGQNMGPWVRLYMNGNEGEIWPWCAGFVTFIMKQAYPKPPFKGSYSCDELARQAKSAGLFHPLPEPAIRSRLVKPGSIFLIRSSPGDWTHTGFVTRVKKDIFTTIEGNTNDHGGREGYKVSARTRSFNNNVDFIVFR